MFSKNKYVLQLTIKLKTSSADYSSKWQDYRVSNAVNLSANALMICRRDETFAIVYANSSRLTLLQPKSVPKTP